MSRESVLPLESYRLAQYAVALPCYVCDAGNTFDAELCQHCGAPLALTHQARTQKISPYMVAAIGPSGVGKTVYLGMLLDMLSRRTEHLQLLARGAFSINLQQTAMGALGRGEFPRKTPNEPDRWNWVHCQVRRHRPRRDIDLIMPDLAGEALIEEIDHPQSYPVVRTYLQKARGLLLLMDASRLHEGERDQDYFTLKLLTYLIELNGDRKRGWPARPVALVFSKSDQCEACFADPAGYAERVASPVYQFCRERLRVHQFFAAGTVGGIAYRNLPGEGRVRIPLRVEPRGIIEPFEWLTRNVR